MIPGSEGLKDAHANLYTYAEEAQKMIFYDHSCSYSEYGRNRESGFYKNSRFFMMVSMVPHTNVGRC